MECGCGEDEGSSAVRTRKSLGKVVDGAVASGIDSSIFSLTGGGRWRRTFGEIMDCEELNTTMESAGDRSLRRLSGEVVAPAE